MLNINTRIKNKTIVVRFVSNGALPSKLLDSLKVWLSTHSVSKAVAQSSSLGRRASFHHILHTNVPISVYLLRYFSIPLLMPAIPQPLMAAPIAPTPEKQTRIINVRIKNKTIFTQVDKPMMATTIKLSD